MNRNLESTTSGTTKYFDRLGLLRYTSDAFGNKTRFEYASRDGDNLSDDLIAITVQGGLKYNYDYTGRVLSSIKSPTNLSTSYTVSGGKVAEITLPDTGFQESKTQKFEFTYSGYELETIADGRNNITRFSNPSNLRPFKTVVTLPNAGKIYIIAQDGFAFAAHSSGAFGKSFLDSYDLAGIRILPDNSGRIGVSDDVNGSGLPEARAFVFDALDHQTRYQTDPHGYLTAFVDETGISKWIYARDSLGQVLKAIEPPSQVARFNDQDPNVPTNELSGGRVTKYSYDAFHNVVMIEHGFGSDTLLTEKWTYGRIFAADSGDENWSIR